MNTFLLTWNPSKWQWDDLAEAVYEANTEGHCRDTWSCGTTRHISPGDRAFLMRLGVPPKGIMGSGVIVSEPFEGEHWDEKRAESGDTVYRVRIVFDVLSYLPILDEDALSSGPLGEHNWYPQASGTHIPEAIASQLESVWSQTTGTRFEPPDRETLRVGLEGAKRKRTVTTYERDPEAREACLEHHGRRCQVCGLAFEERYGDIGRGFIHVHHLVPLPTIGEEHTVDPIHDLRPVCPNCHAMLHMRTPPIPIDQLTVIVQNSASHGVSRGPRGT